LTPAGSSIRKLVGHCSGPWRPFQSAAVSGFDQIEAVGVVDLDVPIEGKVKQRIRYANAIRYRVTRFEPIHERAFDLGDPDRGLLTVFFHFGV
jgi:hypothetical protein